MVELFRIRLHVFVTSFKCEKKMSHRDAILQRQLTSASARFPRAFKPVTLMFHISIARFFSIGYIGEVCKNKYFVSFCLLFCHIVFTFFVPFYSLFCHILFITLSHFIHYFVPFYSLFCNILFTNLSHFIHYFVTFYSLFCYVVFIILSYLSDVGDDMDQHLKKAYESVLILSLLNPAVNNTVFQEEIKSRALHDYGFEFQKNELVST